jgi:L-Ala-D/L-Glu epimerase
MKIKHTEIFRFSIKMVPFTIATGTMEYAQNVFIRIHTDEGLYGVGECSAFPMIVGETQETCLAMARDFAKLWKGKNPLEIQDRLAELDLFTARNTTIKSAFDIALHDLAAKAAGKPLYQFLGGKRYDIETDITIGIGPAEKMAESAAIFQQKGASILKVKLGKKVEDDLERIEKIREVVRPEMKIRLDANQGWSFEDAKYILNALKDFDIQFCEQPMRTWNDNKLPELVKSSPVNIMADESCYTHYDAINLIEANACDSINIKLSKSGGISEGRRIYEVAEKAGIPCMIGGMLESRLALSAKLHFAYACPNLKYFDMDTCMLGHLEDPVIDGVKYKGYFLEIDEKPGIGADVDETFLKNCEKWVI